MKFYNKSEFSLLKQSNNLDLPPLQAIANFSTKYFILGKVYTDVDAEARGVFLIQAEKAWYNYYFYVDLAGKH